MSPNDPRVASTARDGATGPRATDPAARGLHVISSHAARPAPDEIHDAFPTLAPLSWSRRLFDIGGALALGAVLSPLILTIVGLVKLQGGPVLFQHRRVGRGGRTFHCIKFRTMVRDAEEALRKLLQENPDLRDEWTQNHKLRHDPRVSRLGRFLRVSSLDELPQLWNVLRGEMSLVGPRPIVRAELLRYGRYASRCFSVNPGLTGLWQVKGRNDTTYRRRVAMDKFYVRHRGLLLDLYILLATPLAVIRRSGAY